VKTPGDKASPQFTLTPLRSGAWQLRVLGTESQESPIPASRLPPAVLGLSQACKPACLQHLVSGLAAPHQALRLSDSCYIFCSDVQMTEVCIEISFPPIPTIIYRYVQSLLVPLYTSSAFPSHGHPPSSFPSAAAAANHEVPPKDGEPGAAPALQCSNQSEKGYC